MVSIPIYFRNCWAKYKLENFEKQVAIVPYQRDDVEHLNFLENLCSLQKRI